MTWVIITGDLTSDETHSGTSVHTYKDRQRETQIEIDTQVSRGRSKERWG